MMGLREIWDGARQLPRGGVVSVGAGFLLHLSLGIMYSAGNLTTYLTSYLHVRLGLPVDYGDTVWVSSVAGLAQGPGVFVGSMIYARWGPRPAILLGGVLCSSGMALTYLTVQKTLVAVILSFGLVSGFGVGLAYASPMLAGYCWFPRNRGLVSGIISGGFGLGGILFTLVQTGFLNPDNVSPEDDGFFHDEALLDRVPSIFLVQAGIIAGLQTLGVLGVHKPSAEYEASTKEETSAIKEDISAQDGGQAEKSTDADGDAVAEEAPSAWKQNLLTPQYVALMATFVLNGMAMSTINSFWKAYGQTFIKDDHFLAMVGVGASVFNMSGRVFWGLVHDASSYKPTMVGITGLAGALAFTLPSTELVGSGLFLVWVWAFFFCVAGNFSVVVTGMAATFGAEHAGHLYGVSFITASLCSPLTAVICDAVLDRFSYAVLFLVGGGFLCVTLAATLTFRRRRPAGEQPPPAQLENTEL